MGYGLCFYGLMVCLGIDQGGGLGIQAGRGAALLWRPGMVIALSKCKLLLIRTLGISLFVPYHSIIIAGALNMAHGHDGHGSSHLPSSVILLLTACGCHVDRAG
jgi:hypothetical protein